jgi:FkbM family methyltransferase
MSIKEKIRSIPVMGELALWLNSRITGVWKSDPSYWLPRILKTQNAVVVQIGSNDGLTGDPLHRLLHRRKHWKALFVEPVPFLFSRLQKNYSNDSRFAFENSVVNDGNPTRFYWVSEEAKKQIPNLPSWYDQLGRFTRTHITKYLPETDPFIEESNLPGITFRDLLQKHQINNFDLLHIDTEGADFKILCQVNLDQVSPCVILYERKHLSREEENASILFLKNRYFLHNLGADILAIKYETYEARRSVLKPLAKFKIAC